MHGVELFYPGILERTPIRALPLPIVVSGHSGPVAQDLKELGIAPLEEDCDLRAYPRVDVPTDALGFANPPELGEGDADFLFIGDSFGIAAAATNPKGLVQRFAERTNSRIFNLSVAGIGPIREEWLLENVGFEKKPSCVIWMFYAGNDTLDLAEPLIHEHFGRNTWADAYPERRAPRSYLLLLLKSWFPKRPSPAPNSPLEGHDFRLTDGSTQPIWFLPDNLRHATKSRENWETDLGWQQAKEALVRAHQACSDRGIDFLAVYLPTKTEVYLPYVKEDANLLLQTAQRGAEEPLEFDPETFLRLAQFNHHTLEETFLDHCRNAGIACLSARPALQRQAGEGELGYLACDTHWQEKGQGALLEPLLQALAELGVTQSD